MEGKKPRRREWYSDCDKSGSSDYPWSAAGVPLDWRPEQKRSLGCVEKEIRKKQPLGGVFLGQRERQENLKK